MTHLHFTANATQELYAPLSLISGFLCRSGSHNTEKPVRRASLRGGLHITSCDSAGEDSPDSCRRAVIEFTDLGKVRAILDLRKAMDAAERDHSSKDSGEGGL